MAKVEPACIATDETPSVIPNDCSGDTIFLAATSPIAL